MAWLLPPEFLRGPGGRFRDVQVRVMLGFLAGHGRDGVAVAVPRVQVHVSFAFKVRGASVVEAFHQPVIKA